MKLEEIGFYTLSDKRAETATHETPLTRCELILTSRCNFNCPYCRHVGGEDIDYLAAKNVIDLWAKEGLKNIRFSGGEPTLYKYLADLCLLAKRQGVERIAVSTNGSASKNLYDKLLSCGVDDFSISLDACCAEHCKKMTGGIKGAWEQVVDNIRYLSSKTYVTIGVVLTEQNKDTLSEIIVFLDTLGVSDIRVIPSAQSGNSLQCVNILASLINKYPILKHRFGNALTKSRPIRGIQEKDSISCGLCLDDMAVMGDEHYPCIIYMRESGLPIGKVGPNMRQERFEWYLKHNTHEDPICKANCLDVCVEYNNKYDEYDDTEISRALGERGFVK